MAWRSQNGKTCHQNDLRQFVPALYKRLEFSVLIRMKTKCERKRELVESVCVLQKSNCFGKPKYAKSLRFSASPNAVWARAFSDRKRCGKAFIGLDYNMMIFNVFWNIWHKIQQKTIRIARAPIPFPQFLSTISNSFIIRQWVNSIYQY